MKTQLLVSALALALLASCQQAKEDNVPAPNVENPDAKPGLAVTSGKLILPAVKGNPGVVYFALSNNAARPAELAAIAIDGAGKTEIHETRAGTMTPLARLAIPSMETVEFSPGAKHVMVFDLSEKLTAGSTAEMTLTFADGDKVSAPLAIELAGGGTDEHGAEH